MLFMCQDDEIIWRYMLIAFDGWLSVYSSLEFCSLVHNTGPLEKKKKLDMAFLKDIIIDSFLQKIDMTPITQVIL